MGEELDAGTLLAIYKLVLSRYKDLINEKESRSVSEIRAKVSPYTDFIRKKRDELMRDTAPYDYSRHFPTALNRSISYLRSIRTCEFAFSFWLSFEEMDSVKVATAMDKAILLAALLRSFESPDAKVVVTRTGRWFVGFSFNGLNHVVVPASGSLLTGEDATGLFAKDPQSYAFNDLAYENYEE